MTVKSFLRRARKIDRRIDETQERLARMRARLEAGRSADLSGMPRGGARDWTDTADRVIELERWLAGQIRDMCRIKQEAMDAIASVDDEKLREVLELYYLDGYTWAQVADAMHYSRSNVLRLHGLALLRVSVPVGGGANAQKNT